jgi:hypothetical protein
MTFPILAPSTWHLAGLRLLCGIGGCAGFTIVWFGLRLERNPRSSSQESRPEADESDSAQEYATAQSCAQPEVIHLSTDPSPARSSEMTQQERIAAALNRAGMTSSGRPQPEIRTASALLESPTESVTKSAQNLDAKPLPSRSGLKTKLILLAGTTLALLSLISLFALR